MNVRTAQTRRSFLGTAVATVAGAAFAPHAAFGDRFVNAVAPYEVDIGVCTSVANAALLREAGAAYIEEGVRGLLIPDRPDEEFAEKLKAAEQCGLPVRAANGFLPGSLKCVGPEANHEAVLAFAETAFRRAALVGIRHIVFGSSGARSIPDGFDRRQAELQFVALLGKMAMLARPHNVVIVIEPLNRRETNFINSVEEGAMLARAVQHPNVMLLADIYHMLCENEPAENIRAAGDLIRHLHIAEKEGRRAPGVGGEDFTPYFQALHDIGYKGGISIECRWSEMAEELPKAVKTMREQMGKVR
ncbi:MAG: sugar phosphate isomerase/epimerase [Phycisphaerales bacterium]|nr:MAG: sugar phosphate isomerase/epimerase [Phycisphaerales bacterium]